MVINVHKFLQEDHLNPFSHPNISDIRLLCKHASKCNDRRNLTHLAKFRHLITFEDSGVVPYYNLSKNINFVQNQLDNIESVIRYTRQKIKTIFDSRTSIESFESPKVYQDFIIKDLIDEVDKRDIHLLSGFIQGTVITIPSTDITDHFVLPLTILQTCEHYIIDHPEISSDIPVYIY
ncbi:unnamed protein product [Rotaria sp. Silwood2]|nr:unnamed protein product [Rotaria sp. Silwood2]